MTAGHAVNMETRRTIGMVTAALGVLLSSCALLPGSSEVVPSGSDPLLYEGEEAVLARPRQLTFEGQNAEAYFAPDDGRLVFQATPESLACDQIFTMRIDGSFITVWVSAISAPVRAETFAAASVFGSTM